jgi:peptidoglycan/xylan/chitin deacetylase (PgdA/CDA1 family)
VLYAGIAWTSSGFELAVVDEHSAAVVHTRKYGGAETEEMIAYLLGLTSDVVTVIDSSNGAIDGKLMNAGLAVYRADLALLPRRVGVGSVPAAELADIARKNLSGLTRLDPGRGTQTGMEKDLKAMYTAAVPSLTGLAPDGRYIGHGSRADPTIALTFDDGPAPPYTNRILDILEQYGVPGTFFCVGLYAACYREEVARMREQGHTIGNHTWSHPFLPQLTKAQFADQLTSTGDALAAASGSPPPTLFRPPYGTQTPESIDWAVEQNADIVLWDVAPNDWAMPGADVIADRVLYGAREGSIVLLHDGGGDRSQTVAALPAIIEGLLGRGFRFAGVEHFLQSVR